MATKPMPNEELVEVFDTQEESEALVIKGLLETAGIPALITGLDAPQEVLPGVGGVVVRVPAEQAEEARRMIDEYRTQDGVSEDESLSGELPPEEPA
jgi:Putative prokaryotic signal transducing protein